MKSYSSCLHFFGHIGSKSVLRCLLQMPCACVPLFLPVALTFCTESFFTENLSYEEEFRRTMKVHDKFSATEATCKNPHQNVTQ